MSAGDNTLNSCCALQAMTSLRGLTDPDEALRKVMHDYVKFMTSPGSHGDTYAESWHRSGSDDSHALTKQLRI